MILRPTNDRSSRSRADEAQPAFAILHGLELGRQVGERHDRMRIARASKTSAGARPARLMRRLPHRLDGPWRLAGTSRSRVARLLVALLVLGALVGPASARPPTELDFHPELDRGLLGEGRQAYRERRDEARAWESYNLFKRYRVDHRDDPVAAWHLAMSCYYLGIRVSKDSDEKRELFAEGRDEAELGVGSDPDCGPCHLMLAVNGALWGNEVGIFRTIVGLPRVREHLKRTEELDPRFGGGATYRVQANIYKALPRLFGGGAKPARESIEKAIRVAPEEHLNYAFLASLLANDFKDVDAAARVARTAIAIPEPDPAYVESVDALRGLKRFLKRYTRKRAKELHAGGD